MTIKEYFASDRFAAATGCEILDVGEGYSRVRMLVTPNHLNASGKCQGGAIFTLADLAFAVAVNSHLQLTFSVSSNISFFSNVDQGYLYAEARELLNHHKLPFAEVRVTDSGGKLIAILTSSGYRKSEQLPLDFE